MNIKNIKEIKTKYLTTKECVDEGFLQEANRLFFHPLGLALTICTPIDENITYLIQDVRNEPGGMIYTPEDINKNKNEFLKKKNKVEELRNKNIKIRQEQLGYIIQELE